MPDTTRATRVHTIRRHLDEGGLHDLQLTQEERRRGPDGTDQDGYTATRDGVLMVVVGAYGPNWLRTLSELCGRLEAGHVKCTVIRDDPALGDHEVLTRWATSAELQARRAALAEETSEIRALVRRQREQQRAEEERRALEDAGQTSMF